MGDTPMNYLRTVRMQSAQRLLSETALNLEQVATEVGYQDAFSFSKVFKRVTGESPRDFRRRNEEDNRSPWRFQAG
jgi:transcriptional regulator GlxA family with amidase domain